PIKDRGLYRLTTHNGMIAMPVPERANVTLSVRTYNGSIRSTIPLPDSSERRKRVTMTLGNGSAHVELESFSGTIALRRPGEARPEIERRRRDRGNKEKGDDDHVVGLANLDAVMAEAMAAAEMAIPQALAEAQAAMPEALAKARAAL